MSKLKRIRLGNVFSIEKGKIGIQSAIPGEYDLVTTGESFGKHIEYHFEGDAICIPLISSTGHGHASLKRIHHVQGKFAVGNILAACLNKNPESVVSRFIFYYLSAKKEELIVSLMKGSANVSLKLDDISKIEIWVPTLEEQRAIVARLDAVDDKARQVFAKLDEIEADLNALCRGLMLSPAEGKTKLMPMHELVVQRRPDVLVDRQKTYHFAGVYSFGRGVFKSVVKSGSDFAYEYLSTLKSGDFTYPKLMAWEGALGIVPPECDGLVVSPEFPVFSINTDIILPEILDVYFKTPQIWSTLAEISVGTNQRRRRLQPSAFLNYHMPVPPMAVQKRICETIKNSNEIKRKHAETRQSLKALLPSMLETLFSEH